MPFSKFFIVLVFAGIIPMLAASLIGGAYYFLIIYNMLLFLLWLLDFLITPGMKALEVSRVCEEKFSHGCDNEVVVKIRNNSGYSLKIEYKDEVPLFFKYKKCVETVMAAPHHQSEGKYYVVPQKRGEYIFGNIHLRYKGILRLCVKKAVFDARASYKVYPNLRDLRKLNLSVIKKSQMINGSKKTRVYGTGTEFESLREYSEGDDYRKINWMITARMDKLIVNTYEPEKNQQVFIMLDSSRVMNSEIDNIKKLDYAVNSSFLLADMAIKNGDNTGLLVFDSSVKRYIKPGKGLNQFRLIAENLYNVEENMVTADYKGALRYLNENQKKRSLLCIFTELFNTDEALDMVAALKNIARRHIPLIITINDMRLYEAASRDVKETSDVYLKAASFKLVEQREKIKKIFYQSGIACIDVPPDKLSIEVVNKYLTMKTTLQI